MTGINGITMQGDMMIMEGQTYDLETLTMALQMERANMIEDQLKDQMQSVKNNNDLLKEANEALMKARQGLSSAQSPDDITWEVDQANKTIKLDDGIEIQMTGKQYEWKIVDTKTGEQTRIWGDPHVDQNGDGTTEWDFKNTTTFQLKDGTKITVGTTDYGNNMTVSDTLTITKGDQAVTVSGLTGTNPTISNVTLTGRELDYQTNDGTVVQEGDQGVDDWELNGQDIDQSSSVREMVAGTLEQSSETLSEKKVPMDDDTKALCAKLGLDVPGGAEGLTKAQWQTMIDNIKGAMDSINSSSQLEMIRLQSLSNKRGQAFDMLSNFISKMAKSKDNVASNIR